MVSSGHPGRDQSIRRGQVRAASLRAHRGQEGRGDRRVSRPWSSYGTVSGGQWASSSGWTARFWRSPGLTSGGRDVDGPGPDRRHPARYADRARPIPARDLVISLVNTGMGLPPVVVGAVRFDLPLAQRSARCPRAPLHADRDRDRAARHRGPDRDGPHAGSGPADSTAVSASDGGDRRVTRAAPVAARPRGAPADAGSGDGRVRGVVSEIGAPMMVGGNIRGQTRVLTTATVMGDGERQLTWRPLSR